MHSCLLPNRAVITVHGQDNQTFLNNLLSNTVGNTPVWSGVCTPQGTLLYTVFALVDKDTVYLDCPAEHCMALGQYLYKYIMHSDVQLGLADTWQVGVVYDNDGDIPPIEKLRKESGAKESGAGLIYADPRLPQMGYRYMGTDWQTVSADTTITPPADYDRYRYKWAIPDDGDLISGKSIPLEYGMDELHGVDFTKGCFTGQEAIARTKNRTPVRRRFLPIAMTGQINDDKTVRLNGKNAGTVINIQGDCGVALMRLDRLAPDDIYTIGDTAKAVVSIPDWVVLPK